MTGDRMVLPELVEKEADGDLVREVRAFAAGRIMEAKVEARAGATEDLERIGEEARARTIHPEHRRQD